MKDKYISGRNVRFEDLAVGTTYEVFALSQSGETKGDSLQYAAPEIPMPKGRGAWKFIGPKGVVYFG